MKLSTATLSGLSGGEVYKVEVSGEGFRDAAYHGACMDGETFTTTFVVVNGMYTIDVYRREDDSWTLIASTDAAVPEEVGVRIDVTGL